MLLQFFLGISNLNGDNNLKISLCVCVFFNLCVHKQRRWLGDLGLVGRQSLPAATSAASQCSCSATFSTTAATTAPMSKIAKPVSVASVDLSKHQSAIEER